MVTGVSGYGDIAITSRAPAICIAVLEILREEHGAGVGAAGDAGGHQRSKH